MLEDFVNYIIKTCDCKADAQFLLAVSGGVDSVVMSHLFKSGNFRFSIAHCNFGLRDEESDGDQLFVEKLAEQMGVKIHVIRFETKKYAAEKKISIQMAARDLRYAWFNDLAKNHGYQYIATAHHENDVIETMMLNLSRGTGIRGMMGIRPVKDNLIRPLLFASRSRIETYAKENNLSWRNDSSNDQVKYTRNKIRHIIIPAFESINPSFIRNASSTIQRLEKAGRLLDLLLEKIRNEVILERRNSIMIDRQKILSYPAYDLVLFELLRDFGVSHLSEGDLADLLSAESGKQLHTDSHTITSDRDYLIITRHRKPVTDEISIVSPAVTIEYPFRLLVSEIQPNLKATIPNDKTIAALDADKIKFPLSLRLWRPGDRFHPLGLNGSKKISDFLINCKVPVPGKQEVWVLESDHKIIWLVNHRLDDRFKITAETSKILFIKYDEEVKIP